MCLHTKMFVEICMVRVLLIKTMISIYKMSRHHIVSDIPKLLALVSLVIHISVYTSVYIIPPRQKFILKKVTAPHFLKKIGTIFESAFFLSAKVGGEASTDEVDKLLERWTQQIEVGTNARIIMWKLVQHKEILYNLV